MKSTSELKMSNSNKNVKFKYVLLYM